MSLIEPSIGNAEFRRVLQSLDWRRFAVHYRFDLMKPKDLDAVLAIERIVYPDPWNRWVFVHEMYENPYAHLLLLRTRELWNRLVGYAMMRILSEDAHLTNLAIHPNDWGKGLGKHFLAFIMDYAYRKGGRKMWLEVRKTNLRALRLYSIFGFRFVRELPGYYPNGEDAFVLVTELEGLTQIVGATLPSSLSSR